MLKLQISETYLVTASDGLATIFLTFISDFTPTNGDIAMNYDLIVQNIVKHKAIKLTTKKVEDSTMAKKGKKTELHFASEQGNLARVKALLAHCDEAEINQRDQCAFAPLHYAAKEGHLAVVKALLAAGADVQLKELYNDREALPWAIEREHVDVMKVLLAHGADPNR